MTLQLDDWVLCRIRHKSDTSVKFDSKNDNASTSYDDHQIFEEKAFMEKISYLNEFELASKEREIINGYGHFDMKEATSQHYISEGNFDSQENIQVCSTTDALVTIRRVLSVENMDELLMPNNRPFTLTSNGSDISDIFDLSYPEKYP